MATDEEEQHNFMEKLKEATGMGQEDHKVLLKDLDYRNRLVE